MTRPAGRVDRRRGPRRLMLNPGTVRCPDCGEPLAGNADGFPRHIPGCSREERTVADGFAH